MKNLFLTFLILFTVLVPNLGQSSNFPMLFPEDEIEDINLEGSFDDESNRSPQIVAIRATISSTSLKVTFLSNVGNISVEVYTASGSQVYIYNVNTQTQTSLSIDVSAWDIGAYEIKFVNTAGNYMYGVFDID